MGWGIFTGVSWLRKEIILKTKEKNSDFSRSCVFWKKHSKNIEKINCLHLFLFLSFFLFYLSILIIRTTVLDNKTHTPSDLVTNPNNAFTLKGPRILQVPRRAALHAPRFVSSSCAAVMAAEECEEENKWTPEKRRTGKAASGIPAGVCEATGRGTCGLTGVCLWGSCLFPVR